MNEELFLTLMPISYMIIEAYGSICFFDTFLELRRSKKYRLLTVFILTLLAGYMGKLNLGLKFIFVSISLILPTYFWCKVSWGKCLFLSLAHYGILYLCDFILLLVIERIKLSWDRDFYYWSFLIFLEKILWLGMLWGLRAFYRQRKSKTEATDRVWFKLCVVPLVTVVSLIVLYLQENTVNSVSTVTVVVLVIVNVIFIMMVQNILEEQKKAREQAARNQSIQGQLAVYRDMQEVYENQRKKMHDYKKQLTAVQTLLAGNHVEEADRLLKNLNGSIAVDMSVVNTNQHTVNAVLNQEIAKAKQKGIPVMLKINDLQGITLSENEVVILLANLLDNAIAACEKVFATGGKPVIHLKLLYKNGGIICSVKNPVTEKVEIVDNVVQTRIEPGHGLGLLNVKELADKYGGDMVISCDEKEFSVVVMLPC